MAHSDSDEDRDQEDADEDDEKEQDEAADVFISLLNLCEAAGIDLAAATEAKIARNAEKYPVALAAGRLYIRNAKGELVCLDLRPRTKAQS